MGCRQLVAVAHHLARDGLVHHATRKVRRLAQEAGHVAEPPALAQDARTGIVPEPVDEAAMELRRGLEVFT